VAGGEIVEGAVLEDGRAGMRGGVRHQQEVWRDGSVQASSGAFVPCIRPGHKGSADYQEDFLGG